MRPLTRLCCALFVALLPLLSTLLMPTASAANFTVNSLADTPDANTSDGVCADSTGACTLRAAIEQANAAPSGDVIGFGVNGTINLNSVLPDISTSMTINGPGASQLTVQRAIKDFEIEAEPRYRIFKISSGAVVHISGLTVSQGMVPLPANGEPHLGGSGIYNAGDLTLTGVNVAGNLTPDSVPSVTPVSPPDGGGIHNDGILTMTDCLVAQNATGNAWHAGSGINGGNGGGIYNVGTLVMTGCTVRFNRTGNGGGSAPRSGNGGAGGGIYNARNGPRQVSATLTNCVVSGNETEVGGFVPNNAPGGVSGNGGDGGGIYNASTMTLIGSTVSGNSTTRGASVTLGGQVQAGKGGSGGGIYNDIPAGRGKLKMINCVVSSNKTGLGGVSNGTVLSHGDGGDGGGIANPSADSAVEMSNCTVVFNATGGAGDLGGRDGWGGGVYGFARVRSSIIALNLTRFPTSFSDVAGGPLVSLGYNLLGYFGSLTGHAASTDRGGGDSGPLAKLDQNLIPMPGSLAIDAGLARDTDDNAIMNDRRGAMRPFDFPDAPPQTGGDDSDIGAFERQAAEPTPTQVPTSVQIGSTHTITPRTILEGCKQEDVGIRRFGATDVVTVVEYVVTATAEPSAHWRGDFTYTRGKVAFAPGEIDKTIPLLLTDDSYGEDEPMERFVIQIVGIEGGQVSGDNPAVFSIDTDSANQINPIDDNAIFICQHYHDLLSRQADEGGQAFWTARLNECGTDAACLDRQRTDVSAAFFLSTEFLNTGYYVIRINKVGQGDRPDVPTFLKFEDEAQEVARGVIVGQPGYETVLDANKQQYTEDFVSKASFQTLHAGQTAAQYVDSLFANAGATPTDAERDAAISAFGAGGTAGQAAALRSVAESGSVYNKLYNEAFVLMQYFGYLRRNPDDAPDGNFDGYQFWLDKLDSATLPGEDARDETVAIRRIHRAEMVRAFLRSSEYRGRFGGDPSRGEPIR